MTTPLHKTSRDRGVSETRTSAILVGKRAAPAAELELELERRLMQWQHAAWERIVRTADTQETNGRR
jgi:hypothetical protein